MCAPTMEQINKYKSNKDQQGLLSAGLMEPTHTRSEKNKGQGLQHAGGKKPTVNLLSSLLCINFYSANIPL